jgi:hypothetical protein
MERFYLSISSFIAVTAMVVLLGGCGGSTDGNTEIEVKTGSLSKAEFISRADAICQATRNRFTVALNAFGRAHKPPPTGTDQTPWLGEIVNEVVAPNYEKGIKEIGALGAPPGYEKEVAKFVNGVQSRIEEIRNDPAELNKTPFPFAKETKIASSYGMTGCANSFG